MTILARIFNNQIQEIFRPLGDFTIEESFTPEVVAMFEPVPDYVEVGWRFYDGEWKKP